MAKWCKEELDQNGVEPSPIECWRKFHVSKAKDGGEEHWKSQKTKNIYDDLTKKKDMMEEVFGEANDWEIYETVIPGPSHGRVLGLGTRVKYKESHLSNQMCNKPACLEQQEDYQRVKGQVQTLTDKVEDLSQLVKSLLSNNSTNSKCARNSHYVDNIATDASAHHDEYGRGEYDANGGDDEYEYDDADGDDYGDGDEYGDEYDDADGDEVGDEDGDEGDEDIW